MTPFLKHIAQYLATHHADNLADVCLILPNRRSSLFLRKYLAEEIGKVTWAPAFYSIEDFIAQISGLVEVDILTLVFELFEVHREIEGVNAQSFEEFLRWGPQLLNDFNEVDRYMADPAELFSTLTEARAISLWNLDNQPLTEFEKKYLHFYQSLFSYYQKLTERLKAKNHGYQGLIFRDAAGKIEAEIKKLPWKKFLFAGFNALTRAEEVIIEVMATLGHTGIFWDADHYYFDNRRQEAGDFLRRYMRKWPGEGWITDELNSTGKEIRLIGSPDPSGQVKYCGNLLQQLALQGYANEKTAVVLLDEGLLIPLLNSIPDEAGSVNITAGLPLKQTPLAGLFESLFQLQLHTMQFTYLASGGKQMFYYRDVLKMLRHPYVRRTTATLPPACRTALRASIDRISEGNRIFIGLDDITLGSGALAENPGILRSVFRSWENPADAVSACRDVTESLRVSLADHDEPGTRMDMEYLFAFSRVFNGLGNILAEFPSGMKLPAFYQLYQQVLSSTSLPFFGEPLKGVQVMGMLETRTLDFENIIMLSCNEDLLPSGKLSPSFIPFDLKRSFNLPTYRHKDSVYAYHFYRLIQRAKNVWILYNTEPDQLGGGEKSRFLRQITGELPGINPKIVIRESLLAVSPGKREPLPEIVIPKTDDVCGLLEKKALKGFSASTLNAYRNCPLKFYYSEIAGIREPEETDETIDPAILGSVVHEALHHLYLPFRDKTLTAGMLTGMKSLVESAVNSAFEKKHRGYDIAYGKNFLFVSVAKLMIRRFLDSEIEHLSGQNGETTVVSLLEEVIESSIPVPVGNKLLDVRLKGILDRVDKTGGCWKIMDYKTGSVDKKHVNVREWEDLRDNPDLNIAFQLMMYGLLMRDREGTGASFSAGIISLRKINAGYIPVSVPGGDQGKSLSLLDGNSLACFEEILKKVLGDIFNREIPFSQTEDAKVCERCPYVNLCGR